MSTTAAVRPSVPQALINSAGIGMGMGTSNIKEIFNDWYLPSLLEMLEMNPALYDFSVGNFSTDVYWTSSQHASDVTQAQIVNVAIGNNGSTTKSTTYGVRACRTFIAGVGEYALRDIGPAGGFIFYINGTTYHEAAANDQSSAAAWSNITNASVGTTGNQIADGPANTALIIGQSGHTSSAAKLCNDLVI